VLTRDQLAQARGCVPENPCYAECCEAAQYAIDGEYADMETPAERDERLAELAAAEKWAAGERWV